MVFRPGHTVYATFLYTCSLDLQQVVAMSSWWKCRPLIVSARMTAVVLAVFLLLTTQSVLGDYDTGNAIAPSEHNVQPHTAAPPSGLRTVYMNGYEFPPLHVLHAVMPRRHRLMHTEVQVGTVGVDIGSDGSSTVRGMLNSASVAIVALLLVIANAIPRLPFYDHPLMTQEYGIIAKRNGSLVIRIRPDARAPMRVPGGRSRLAVSIPLCRTHASDAAIRGMMAGYRVSYDFYQRNCNTFVDYLLWRLCGGLRGDGDDVDDVRETMTRRGGRGRRHMWRARWRRFWRWLQRFSRWRRSGDGAIDEHAHDHVNDVALPVGIAVDPLSTSGHHGASSPAADPHNYGAIPHAYNAALKIRRHPLLRRLLKERHMSQSHHRGRAQLAETGYPVLEYVDTKEFRGNHMKAAVAT